MKNYYAVQRFLLLCIFAGGFGELQAQPINRKALVQRHTITVNEVDSLASLTAGNGAFAFTVDITGLQTFPERYRNGVPLGTQSEWGWHSFIDTAGYKREETHKPFHLNGREITYTTQWNTPERNKQAANWFRQNPHRLQLGTIGFELLKKDGTPAMPEDITGIQQQLDLWTGIITSRFSLEGIHVEVVTVAHDRHDVIAVNVRSALLREGRLKIRVRFPYPTGEWADNGTHYKHDERHSSVVIQQHNNGCVLARQLDSTRYAVSMKWSGAGRISQRKEHDFIMSPATGQSAFSFSARFWDAGASTTAASTSTTPSFTDTKAASLQSWAAYWNSGGAIDFSGSTDPRAAELERRIILSQYLMRVQEAGHFPPQETGLTYNSWFGKPHLEMHWWHATHYALWGRTEFLEKSLDWYRRVAGKAKAIAVRQGFDGIRWQKMTDHSGEETPSSIGALLVWQQPHFIYFAELCYRDKKNKNVLKKYSDLVFATAEFMASFPYYDTLKKRYILGKGVIPAQERFKAEETFNPTYELVYWHWALDMAQQWRTRLGLPRHKKWDEVITALSPLPVQEGKYLFTESATDSYTHPEYRTDHPAVLGAFGMMPATGQVDTAIMRRTFNWIWDNWSWADTWGWDFPLTAMTTTRMGWPEKTIEAILMNSQTNRYLVNGHNYQDERLRIYMPGNGGLLAVAAMMCAGYDGCTVKNPGIPKNNLWKVRWEGLKPIP